MEALVTIVAFGIIVVALYSLVQITRADGKSDFCYVTPDTSGVYFTDKYRLTRHIPWRSDRVVLRNIATAEEARQEAVKFGCEIR